MVLNCGCSTFDLGLKLKLAAQVLVIYPKDLNCDFQILV